MIAIDLGRISFEECILYQKKIHAARTEGRLDDMIFLLEHNPVITFGKSAKEDELLVAEEDLTRRGISLHHIDRGGKITCHYPGQLVGYPIMNLKNHGRDLHAFVGNLEETVIRVLSDFGIKGERVENRPGIWVQNQKIASIGIEVKKWVTMHGFSINIMEVWDYYSLFIPCGIRDKGTTFLETCLASAEEIDMQRIKLRILKYFSDVFGVSMSRHISRDQFDKELAFLEL